MRFDKSTRIALPLVILAIGAALFFFLGCETAHAQTYSAGTFAVGDTAQPYTATADQIMSESRYGADWRKAISRELLKHLMNRYSEAREAARERATEGVALPDEDLQYLLPQEVTFVTNTMNSFQLILDTLRARKLREGQRLADSAAAATQGYLDEDGNRWIRTIDSDGFVAYAPAHLVLYNRGKSLPPKYLIRWTLDGVPSQEFSIRPAI